MNVKQLIEELLKLPQDAVVAGYAENAEASFLINKIKNVTEKTQPYDKGRTLFKKMQQDKIETKNVIVLWGND